MTIQWIIMDSITLPKIKVLVDWLQEEEEQVLMVDITMDMLLIMDLVMLLVVLMDLLVLMERDGIRSWIILDFNKYWIELVKAIVLCKKLLEMQENFSICKITLVLKIIVLQGNKLFIKHK